MDKKEFRVLIKYCFLKEINTVEAKTWLDVEFPDTAPGKSTIKDCYGQVKLQPRTPAKLLSYVSSGRGQIAHGLETV
ncbi:hypothetical protein GWI33_022210 [Rhynchophorus ferrugineus]|uniref:Mos1 transposase HTH domain-containing protein n=1 Tax=Rhynchophorus ferrugineus TaxID=354439 RepID=A0A834J0P1_RHYFE|nr:hypothetical protein GWI33_022210 [Rhynchophorus ferrugineus]